MKNSVLIIIIALLLIVNIIAIVIVIENIPKQDKIKSELKLIEDNEINGNEIEENDIINFINKGKKDEDVIDNHIYHRYDEPDEDEDLPEWINYNEINITNSWMNVYGEILINDNPASVGDKIACFNEKGILVGIYTIKTNGEYGFIHVFGDDITTKKEEGAKPRDKIHFKVYDKSEDKVINLNSSLDVYFEEFGKLRIDLII